MTKDDAKRLYQRLLTEIWNGDGSSADTIVSPDFTMHTAGITSDSFKGPDGLRRLVTNARAPFSTITFFVALGPIVQDGLLSALWSAQGTYAGGVPGASAAVGTPVKFNGHDFFRFDKSRFVEYWGGADDAELMSQLGMFPRP